MFDWFRRLFGFDPVPDIAADSAIAWQEPAKPYIENFIVQQTDAALAHSLTIGGVFSRFHDKPFAPPHTPLWRSFLDDQLKWSNQGRFAGANLNCGHFFALSRAGAVAEAKHYKVDLATTDLLEVDLVLDKVLDLSNIDAIRAVFDAVANLPHASDSFIAEEMIEEDTGGTVLTDRIGVWAARRGYDGILFFGARIIYGPDVVKHDGMRPPSPWNANLVSYELEARRDMNELNMMVFRGLCLLGRIRKYRVNSRAWIDNEFFGKSEEEIDALLKTIPEYAPFDLDFQTRQARFHIGGKVQYQGD